MSDQPYRHLVDWRQMASDLAEELSERNRRIVELTKTTDRADGVKERLKLAEAQIVTLKDELAKVSKRPRQHPQIRSRSMSQPYCSICKGRCEFTITQAWGAEVYMRQAQYAARPREMLPSDIYPTAPSLYWSRPLPYKRTPLGKLIERVVKAENDVTIKQEHINTLQLRLDEVTRQEIKMRLSAARARTELLDAQNTFDTLDNMTIKEWRERADSAEHELSVAKGVRGVWERAAARRLQRIVELQKDADENEEFIKLQALRLKNARRHLERVRQHCDIPEVGDSGPGLDP